MSSRLIDPLAAAREDEANRQMALAGSPVRFCFHADATMDAAPGLVRRSCDYCDAAVVASSGEQVPQMGPWAYVPDGYTAHGRPPLTRQ
jgi:hypothetical protein